MFHKISVYDGVSNTEKFFLDVPYGEASKRVDIPPEVAKYILSLHNDIGNLENKISLMKSGVVI